ncbi:hypothetical protein ACFQGW_20285 [Xanthomonas theicola]
METTTRVRSWLPQPANANANAMAAINFEKEREYFTGANPEKEIKH